MKDFRRMSNMPLRSSIVDKDPTITKKPKSASLNNHRRSHLVSSNGTIPIITLPSFSDYKEKFLRITTNNKSSTFLNTSMDSSMTRIKSSTPTTPNRLNVINIPKSPLLHPAIVTNHTPIYNVHYQQNQNSSFSRVVSTPITPNRTTSGNVFRNRSYHLASAQWQNPIVSRPQSRYEHFLANLRQQSSARMRRKREQDEGNNETTEAKVTLKLDRNLSMQTFQLGSNYSLSSLTADSSSTPTISIKAKRGGKSLLSHYQFQDHIKNYRLNQFRATSLKNFTNHQIPSLSSSSLLITPRNSVADDNQTSSNIKPLYELYLNNDMLNYCYVSNDSGIKYQGQMLSTSF